MIFRCCMRCCALYGKSNEMRVNDYCAESIHLKSTWYVDTYVQQYVVLCGASSVPVCIRNIIT